MLKQTLEEWQAEMETRFESKTAVAFVCPACGKVTTIKEHMEAGGRPDHAPQQCIGRTTGLGSKNQKDIGYGCNWTAFGLFGTLGKGREVVFPYGNVVEVFDFVAQEVLANA